MMGEEDDMLGWEDCDDEVELEDESEEDEEVEEDEKEEAEGDEEKAEAGAGVDSKRSPFDSRDSDHPKAEWNRMAKREAWTKHSQPHRCLRSRD